jgi:hypothetical protein
MKKYEVYYLYKHYYDCFYLFAVNFIGFVIVKSLDRSDMLNIFRAIARSLTVPTTISHT